MLFAHKLIDLLDGKKSHGEQLLTAPGTTNEYMAQLSADLKVAEKFDFGDVVLELSEEVDKKGSKYPVYEVPKLTLEEMEFWAKELIPLPAPVVWYEYILSTYRSGFLVRFAGGEWHIQRCDYVWAPDKGVYIISVDGCTVSVPLGQTSFDAYTQGGLKLTVGGAEEFISHLERRGSLKHYTASVRFVIYLTLMLNSKTTERKWEEPPPKLNKKRMANGHAPMYRHRIVTIVPKEYMEAREPGQGGHHRSPRLHWRRSHLRTYGRGTGQEKYVVIPRHLVGRADLGEVSHEYRVRRD